MLYFNDFVYFMLASGKGYCQAEGNWGEGETSKGSSGKTRTGKEREDGTKENPHRHQHRYVVDVVTVDFLLTAHIL